MSAGRLEQNRKVLATVKSRLGARTKRPLRRPDDNNKDRGLQGSVCEQQTLATETDGT